MNDQGSSSDWETEVDYDIVYPSSDHAAASSTQHQSRFRKPTITLVLSPTRDSSQDRPFHSISQRRNTMPSSGSSGLLREPCLMQPTTARENSFVSRSSIYSDMSRSSFDAAHMRHEKFSPVHQHLEHARPATTLLDRDLHGNLTAPYSKTSTADAFKSETSTCRSLFLSPSAERDVSRALRTLETVPSSRRRVSFTGTSTGHLRDIQEHHMRSFYNEDAKVDNFVKIPVQSTTPSPKHFSPTAQSSPDGPMLRFRDGLPNAHDSDWETVTSDQLFSRQNMSQFQTHMETGSSVADVSDTISYGYCGTSHPPPMSFTSGPGYGAARKPSTRISTRTRLQAAVRHVSSSLDGISASRERGERGAQAFEMKQFNGSFESLNSTASSEYFGSGNHWQGFESSRDPQRVLFAGVSPTDGVNGLVGIPRLPFPLISLPEAAKLQKGRIERGEEDHTDPGGSFVTRAYSETRSTISSTNSPRTPRSVLFSHSQVGSSRDQFDKSSPAYSRWDSPRSHGLSNDSNERVSSLLLLGGKRRSQILKTPDPRSSYWLSADEEFRQVAPRLLRLRGFSASTRERRARDDHQQLDQSLFTASESRLMVSARADILHRRRYAQDCEKRLASVFISVALLSVIFPVAGILALCGAFNSTITWCTHGEMAHFSVRQRTLLRRLLFAELVVYMGLVIILSLYFSVGL
ncbi:hypothetical protein LLEC1_05255 [Akanthomyces lecanii]|uniref:Transmembrane protein n=1 Tax=Cordyceps confragosa TaxID=2714763 RepID=A0A179I6L9_CORDF|nr:hypothetical protein LLEC1_05255 [Akanthomyces lecanii]